MSPNTTPSAPSNKAAPAGWAAAAGVETAAEGVLLVVLLGMAGRFHPGRGRVARHHPGTPDITRRATSRVTGPGDYPLSILSPFKASPKAVRTVPWPAGACPLGVE